jgi:hypothetical protein
MLLSLSKERAHLRKKSQVLDKIQVFHNNATCYLILEGEKLRGSGIIRKQNIEISYRILKYGQVFGNFFHSLKNDARGRTKRPFCIF